MTPEEEYPREAEDVDSAEIQIKDNGGTRSGMERRQKVAAFQGADRRSGRERRRGFDRRTGIDRRRSTDRRSRRFFWDGGFIERRDALRRFSNEE